MPELVLPTGKTYDHKGKVAFADNQVDTSTGTIPIYADFPNPDRVLLPGQFVTALVRTAETKREPVVPASAILRTRDGEQVYVVGQDNRVEQRTIETGVQVGTGYAVTSGLQSGEVVIVSGVQKVKPGMVVKPVKQSAASATAVAMAPVLPAMLLSQAALGLWRFRGHLGRLWLLRPEQSDGDSDTKWAAGSSQDRGKRPERQRSDSVSDSANPSKEATDANGS